MVRSYIAFGSNIGRRKYIIEKAIRRLAVSDGIELRRVSPLYETEPVGGPEQGSFYNGVLEIETELSPLALWKTLRKLESASGRVRRMRWGPRTLDLDILTFGKIRLHSEQLEIPHPRYHLRRFVLVPFVRLAPQMIHPIIKKKNKSLLRELTVMGQRVTMVGPWKKFRFLTYKKRKVRKSRS